MSNCIDPLNINFKPSYEGELLLLGVCSYTATEKDGSLNWKENEELKVYGDEPCIPSVCTFILDTGYGAQGEPIYSYIPEAECCCWTCRWNCCWGSSRCWGTIWGNSNCC